MTDSPLWQVAVAAGPALPYVLLGLCAGLFVVALTGGRS
jgi:hypothetical protein